MAKNDEEVLNLTINEGSPVNYHHDKINLSYKTQEVLYIPKSNESENSFTKLEAIDQGGKRKDPFFLYATVFTASSLHMCGTMGFSWTSPVIPKLENPNNPLGYAINASQKSWISSILFIGAIFGPLISVKMADVIGRKKTLILLAFPLLIADFTMAFAKEIYLFYIARFLCGISLGSILAVLPMYINEITENHNRGKYGCIMCIFGVTGVLFPYIVGPLVDIQTFCLSCTCPLFIFLITFFTFMPDSPQYLILKNKEVEATNALMLLRNKSQDEVQKELSDLTLIIQNTSGSTKPGIKEVFSSPGLRKGLMITSGLVFIQQGSGSNVVLGYMQPIFEASHTNIQPHMSAILVGVIQLLTMCVTTAVVEKFGRKPLLLTSSTGAAISISILGTYFFLQKQNINVEFLWWLPLASLIGYIISYNLGLGALPWMITAEIFPTSIKSTAGSLTSCACFITCSFVLFAFPLLSEMLGMAQCFWMFGGVLCVGIVFISIVVPETKKRSVADIQNELSGRNNKV